MNRYILAPAAARDLVDIWRYIKHSSFATADRVRLPQGAGHRRPDLTRADVRFFPVYSYWIVYRPETKPLQVVAILHGSRHVARLLLERLR